MKRSLNEVTNEFRKAACGAGYPFGVAEDIARAGAALISAGYDGAAAVAEILPDKRGERLSQTALNATALFDCAAGGEGGVKMQSVDAPLILAGCALASARQYGCAFRLETRNGVFDVEPAGLPDDYSRYTFDGSVSVTLAGQHGDILHITANSEPLAGQGVDINESVWPLIKQWSMATCVAASEQSRISGAGAGLNDND